MWNRMQGGNMEQDLLNTQKKRKQPGNQSAGNMEQSLLNIGHGSNVVADRVIAIVSPNSAPMKRLKDEAKDDKRLVDATHGRKTRSIIITDSNHIILSALHPETISQRYLTLNASE